MLKVVVLDNHLEVWLSIIVRIGNAYEISLSWKENVKLIKIF
jgi:hypothetical protein